MIDGTTAARDAVLVAVALIGGFLAGSIPTVRIVGGGHGNAPGWGFLGLTVDLAKGVVPVAIGMVTWSWWIGWAAGLGAVLGACWPDLRHPIDGHGTVDGHGRDGIGGPGLTTLGGAVFTLAPAAGALGALLALATLGAGRLAGRDARAAAAIVGLAGFPALLLVVHRDLPRLFAVLVVGLVVLARAVRTSRDRPSGGARLHRRS